MHTQRKRLGRHFPARAAALRWLKLARIRQMQSRTSLFRFVREHLMRHAERCRENFPVESGFLPDAFSRLFRCSSCAATHVLGHEFFGGEDLAAFDELGGFLVQEITPHIRNVFVQFADLLRQAFVSAGAFLFPGALSLQRRQFCQFVTHKARVLDRLAVLERCPVVDTKINTALVIAGALAGTRLVRYAQSHRREPLAVAAGDRHVVGLELDKAMHATGAYHHGIFAAAKTQRHTSAALLKQFPACRVGVAETCEARSRFEARKTGLLPCLDATEERLHG